jgi:hypothetical protein
VNPGLYEVTCRECGAKGTVRIGRELSNGTVKAAEDVPHSEECSKFVRSQPRHLRKRNWRRQEARANALVGARATLASGAVGEDGDGRAFHGWRVESKQTTSSHYRLTQDIWHKLVEGALLVGEEPVLHLQFETWMGKAPFVVVRKDLFQGIFPGREIHKDTRQRNPKSHTITLLLRLPHLVELEPPGVLLHEADLKLITEELDERQESHL